MAESKGSLFPSERVWYDQFTSTDWVHDSIADAYRVKALRSRKDFWGRVKALFDSSQGWILSALCGFIIAMLAYAVNVTEATIFDWKDGYCARGWYINERVSRRVLKRLATVAIVFSRSRGANESFVPELLPD
jgi:chloride channel 3/4/5